VNCESLVLLFGALFGSIPEQKMFRTESVSVPGVIQEEHLIQVTHQMKPLPELEIIPPFSAENKEADIDR
jgi:hypothetical protein